MRPSIWFLLGVLLGVGIVSVGNRERKDPLLDRVVAKVNDYTITVRDFNQEARELAPVFKNVSSLPPQMIKSHILDDMVRREVLLEEAQKLNIDKNGGFMKQVENFWRLSLIKELISRKTNELSGQIKDPDPNVKRQKVQEAIQAWADQLTTQAKVTVDREVLNGLPIGGKQGGGYGQR